MNWRNFKKETGTVPCRDLGKVCLESGTKTIDNVKVTKSCWKYGYQKICDFPSKDNCGQFAKCYEIGLKDCLMWDKFGNCVNRKKEFSCKRREIYKTDKKILKQNQKGNEAKRIICKGIPCIDGNCIDKSYDMDADMMKSVSQLYAASQAKGAKDMNFKLFEGFSQHCTKKPAGYLSCCKVKGWGAQLGANCNQDEKRLHDLRVKNLCVYATKETTGTAPFHTNKHHFCCFGNILNKVFQVEARKQLGISFKNGDQPNCRGLTLSEIVKLDFEKMDFSEFTLELKKRMKLPNINDLETRISNSINPMSKSEKQIGVNIVLEKELKNAEY